MGAGGVAGTLGEDQDPHHGASSESSCRHHAELHAHATGWNDRVGAHRRRQPVGARVLTSGALQLDELVAFEFPADGHAAFLGQARVTREHAAGVYGMRFERIADSDRRELWKMAAGETLH